MHVFDLAGKAWDIGLNTCISNRYIYKEHIFTNSVFVHVFTHIFVHEFTHLFVHVFIHLWETNIL